MRRAFGPRLLATLWVPVVLATGLRARADDPMPTVQSCIAQNERAGPLQRAGKLREARALMRLCSAAAERRSE